MDALRLDKAKFANLKKEKANTKELLKKINVPICSFFYTRRPEKSSVASQKLFKTLMFATSEQ